MKIISAVLSSLFILGCAAAPAPVKQDVSPMEKVQFLEAMSKAAAPTGRQIKSMRLTYDARLPANDIKMELVTNYKVPDKLRTETRIPGMPNSIEIFDGENGWTVTKGFGIKPKSARERMFLKLQALLNNPATMLSTIFNDVKMEKEPVEINGVKCRRLVCDWLVTNDIPPIELFVGADDKLIYRTVTTVPTAIGDVNGVTDFSDHRNFDGIVMPVTQKTKVLGMEVEAKIKKCELDVPLADKLFTPSAEDEDDDEDQ